jgi:murein DD-endopeptidase MepM/ murein hydrolase activator NlpD
MSGVMRNKFKSQKLLRLLKAATILSIGGVAAGCSSDVVRFSDGFYTGAVPKGAVASSTQPENYGQPNYNPEIGQTVTGSISAQTVERKGLPRPSISSAQAPQPAASLTSTAMPAPKYASPAANTDTIATGSVPPAPERFATAASTSSEATTTREGWSTAGATSVKLRDGETIYNLAKRYGVPAKAIVEVNGISDPKSVSAGQRILIPTYVYSRGVGVSAPDNNKSVQSASAVTGSRNSSVDRSAPAPKPGTQVASLGPVSESEMPARSKVMADGGRYTVAPGDTLSAISRRTGASVAAIRRVNSLTGDNIRVGQALIIPGLSDSGNQQVAAAANVDPLITSKSKPATDANGGVAGYTPPTPSNKESDGSIAKIENQETAKAPDTTGVSAMRWPVQGRVVSAFASNSGGKPNDGIDISVPPGTPVKAAENGVVIYSGDGLKELGKTILVRHGDGIVTVYGHVSELNVKRGETVKRGQQIASSGMSGSAKQPQLHFEVRKNSAPVNPVPYLQ